MAAPDEQASAFNGTKILKAGTHQNLSVLSFVAREVVVVTGLWLSDIEADLSIYGLDGTELYQGELVSFPPDKPITKITFSGSISITLL